jgi:ABC-type amino acid transport substrate-binding protein
MKFWQRIDVFRRTGLVCLLAFVLIGCTTRFEINPMATSALTTATTSMGSLQSSLDQIQARGVLIVGTAITEPFEFHDPDTDELIGFDVEIAQFIAGKLGVELLWAEMPFANLLPSLQGRKVDMTIAAMYINPDREELVDFSEPYINTGLVMVVRPELQAQVKTVYDLSGLIVGVKIGATGAQLAQDLIAQGIALESKEYKETFDSLLDLEVGRVDVVFNDYLNTLVYIKDSQSDLKIVRDGAGEVNFLSHVGLGIGVHQDDRELLDVINATLQEMRGDGRFDRLYETWLMSTSGD